MSISAATVRARIRDGWDPDVAANTPVRPKRPKGSPRKDYYQKKSRAPFDPYTTIGRFWAKVDKSGPTMPHIETPCWPWTASLLPAGYGLFYPAGRGSFGVSKQAVQRVRRGKGWRHVTAP